MPELTRKPITQATAGDVRRSVLEALEGPHVDAAIEQALHLLAAGGDLHLVLAIVKAFVRAGVAGLAVRLLRSNGKLLSDQPELAALADELTQLPSGAVAWESLRSRFEANRDALLEHREHLSDIAETIRCAGDRFVVFRTKTGNLQVIDGRSDDRLRFVLPFADHARHAAAAPLRPAKIGDGTLLLGVPSPAMWDRLVAMRTDLGYEPPMDLIETDSEILALWLHLVEARDALASERVGVFAGDGALAQYRARLARCLCRAAPTHQLVSDRSGWSPPVADRAFFESLANEQEPLKQSLMREQDAIYADATSEHWASRFRDTNEGGPPLRVLGFTTRFSTVIQHAMSSLGDAFKRRGCTFELVKEPDPSSCIVGTWSALAERPYDLLIVINHLRQELADRVTPRVPYVCWIQDYMPALWRREAGRSVGPLDLVLGQSPSVMADLYDYPIDQFLATTNLTDPALYSAERLSPEDLAPYQCDVSYVSHASEPPERYVQRLSKGAAPAFATFLTRCLDLIRSRMREQGSLVSLDLLRILLEAEHDSGHPAMDPATRGTSVYPVIATIYDRVFRHEALHWAARWAESRGRQLRIYGRGWESHPTLRAHAAGEIASGEPLRRLYQASAVSLQVNGYGSLHQRLLDGIAAGARMLCRHHRQDFFGPPMRAISRIIARDGLGSLRDLLDRRGQVDELDDALRRAEIAGCGRIATMDDPARRAVIDLLLRTSDRDESDLNDQGFFRMLARGYGVPDRCAGDLPGFDQITFAGEDELHDQLDRAMSVPERGREIMEPMRRAVLEHDTYDVLAGRIITAFRRILASNAVTPAPVA